MPVEIFFMGLQEQGASLALALARSELDTRHRGYDSNQEAARAVQEAGGVEGLVLNPYEAVQSADLIILSVPAAEAEEYLQEITPDLKSGALVLDCSPVKSGNLEWARQHFKGQNEYIGALPILPHQHLHERGSDFHRARAGYFEDSTMALVIPPEASQQAINLALRVSGAIGTEPFFIEASELDVINSLSDALPHLLGAALLRLASTSEGWPNLQRIAGRTLVEATRSAAEQDPQLLSKELFANREILMFHVRAIVEELEQLYRILDDGDPGALEEVLSEAREAREAWLAARRKGNWRAQELAPDNQEETDLLDRLTGLASRRGREDR